MENTRRIMLIEDDEHDQFFFTQAIQEIDDAILYYVAHNGQEALAKLNSSETLPDLIFTDINMPVMDGVECLSEIIKIPIVQDIPVIVLSSDTSKIGLLTQLGAKAFIAKPDNCKILQKLVEQILVIDFMTIGTAIGQRLPAILYYPN